ncbi:MAG: T9SS type A sorting domain-containing protein [Bacteroidales bacterium]|nr:T9SS type A sorting domain-containing protein [Bacteroidales bacterium]
MQLKGLLTIGGLMLVFTILGFQHVKAQETRASSKEVEEMITFSKSSSSEDGLVYEILPGPAVIDTSQENTPFSNNTTTSTGAYTLSVADIDDEDSPDSQDSIKNVNITFEASNGQTYLIDNINIIHKPEGQGDHTFFGGVGLNKVMHGNTGIGTGLMPKLMSYITLWGITNLKDAETDTVVASERLIHIMTTTDVRNEALELESSTDVDSSDYDIWKAHTHVILPPKNMQGEMDPVPGTDHGFLHMMWEEVKLEEPNREWNTVYEVLPGPAVINPEMDSTPFSNKVSLGAGEYEYTAVDVDDEDSPESQDSLKEVSIHYKRPNGTEFMIDNINIIHKQAGQGDHTFFGGLGYTKIMHGNTGIGVGLMPKLLSYITMWGIADLKDDEGNVLANDRLIHIMTTGRVRTDSLGLLSNVEEDVSDHSPGMGETHIILPPKNTQGDPDPVPNTRHGFLHLMFEKVNIDSTSTGLFDQRQYEQLATSNYPNPFGEQTTIQYELPEATDVSVQIYDVTGRKIATLVNERQMAGAHKIRFEAEKRDLKGGIYFYRIVTEEYKGEGKMTITR